MKWIRNMKRITKKTVAFALTAAMVIGNMNIVAFAEDNGEGAAQTYNITTDIVGYSDARVQQVDLSAVKSLNEYIVASDADKAQMTEVKISSAEELVEFSTAVNDGTTFADVTVYLANDIDVSGAGFTSIGRITSKDYPFEGTFDGQGYEVSGIGIEETANPTAGFFGVVKGAIIKNLIVSGSITTTKNQAGGIVGRIAQGGNTTIDNCYSKLAITATNGGYIGGIVGMVQKDDVEDGKDDSHTIQNCTSTGAVSGKQNVGGIVGGALYTLEITNCRNAGEVTASGGDKNTGCGGIVGVVKNKPVTVEGCINNGAVSTTGGTAMVAGIIGNIQVADCSITGTTNYGAVEAATGGTACGIYGSGKFAVKEDLNSASTTPTETDATLETAKIADTLIVSVDKNIVGYSDARVEGKDLSAVKSLSDYIAASDKTGITEVKISSAEELVAFAANNGMCGGYDGLTIYLANDIDMADVEGFKQIGGSTNNPFKGTFDGQGYEVKNLIISADANGIGFFGYVQGATIRNLIVGTGSTITNKTKGQTGGIVGNIIGTEITTISNCLNKANITASGTYVGGIVGLVSNNSANHVMEHCTNTGNVQTTANVGGIVGGALYTLEVTNCRNAGNVTATDGDSGDGCGGIVGIVKNKTVTVKGCINNGTLGNGTCTVDSTGIYGIVPSTNSGSINLEGNNNYASDNIQDASYEVATTYADTLIGGNAGSNKKTNEAITTDIIGYSDARVTYINLTEVDEFDSTATYNAGDSFKITSKEQLGAFSAAVNGGKTFTDVTVYLANDIDMTGEAFTPIGYNGKTFNGTFDGQGYEVSGISLNETEKNAIGFFGKVQGATIKNLIVSGSITSTKNQMGGIVGFIAKDGNTTIDNCYSKVAITAANGGYIGGIVGMVESGGTNSDSHTIQNCTSTGVVSGLKNVGGIVGGALYRLSITNCRNAGNVAVSGGSSSDGCGGIVGIVKNRAVIVSGCINNGAVSTTGGESNVAGIMGNIQFKDCSITDTTNYGAVTAATGGTAYGMYGSGTFAVKEDLNSAGTTPTETDATLETAKNADTSISKAAAVDAGYSDKNISVEDIAKDLSTVMTFTDFIKTSDDKKPAEVKISTAAELSAFGSYAYTYEGKTVYLANDIDMTGYSYVPVGREAAFKGTFNGLGYEVSGILIEENIKNEIGFFGVVEGATIKNLVLSGSITSNKSQIGGVVGRVAPEAQTTIENCYSKISVTTTGGYVGGIVGMVNKDSASDHIIKMCTNTGTITAGKNAGGIVGGALDTITIENSRNAASIVTTAGAAASDGLGGIVGIIKNAPTKVADCFNNGTLTNKDAGACTIAGVIGCIENTSTGSVVIGSYNYGAGITTLYNGTAVVSGNGNKAGETDAALEAALTADSKDGTPAADTTGADAGYSDARVTAKDLSTIVSFSEYNGESEVKISKPSELAAFAKQIEQYNGYEGVTIYLATDINMSGHSMDTIGGQASEADTIPFKGTFDGRGYQIDNLVIDGGNTQHVGLFGNVYGATIKNLILAENCSISGGTNRVGGIVAMISGDKDHVTTIDNCWNKASVSGQAFVAGIAGFVYVSSDKTTDEATTKHYIRNCTNTGAITASERDAGGIVGNSQTGLEITNCRNTGNITSNAGEAKRGTGGIIGRVEKVAVSVADCINNGAVTTKACTIGGIIGNLNIAGSTITGCRNYGVIVQNEKTVTGNAIYGSVSAKDTSLSDNMDRTGEIDSNVTALESRDDIIQGEPVIDEALYDVVGYSDAYVVRNKNLANVISFTDYMNDTESKAAEIKISTAEELSAFSMTRESFEGVTIYLAADIDMKDYPFYAIGGAASEGYTIPFKGTFDGQGYEVNNIEITANDTDCVGFFGNLQGATVRNLILGENCSVSGGRNRVAGIAGMISGDNGQSTTIENCWNKADVSGTNFVGGIVGFVYITGEKCVLSDGSKQTAEGAEAAAAATTHYIIHCTNTGDITASNRDAGGIAGYSATGLEITNCRNAGSIKANGGEVKYGCGGILGRVSGNPATITNCINNGSVHSDKCTVAGIVGNVLAKGTSMVSCTNYGAVTTAEGLTAKAVYGSSGKITAVSRANKGTVNQTTDSTLEIAMKADEAIGGFTISSPEKEVVINADMVGYSDSNVEFKDLTNVMSFYDYMKVSGENKPKEIKISTPAELSAFSIFRDSYEGVTIYLATDIDMSGYEFYPVGGGSSEAETIPFRGTFDGQGYEVYNLEIIANNTDCVGFFGNLQGARVRNLILGEGCKISGGRNRVGGIAGMISGDEAQATKIYNCWNKAEVTGKNFVGGIVGFVYVTGEKSYLTDGSRQTAEGASIAASFTTHYITNCSNSGDIAADRDAGGIAGTANAVITIEASRNIGKIYAAEGAATQGCGGIIGRISSNAGKIINCINNGYIQSENCTTGGIVGNVRGYGIAIRYSSNYGTIEGASSMIGNPIYGSDVNRFVTEEKNLGVTEHNYEFDLEAALKADTLIEGRVIPEDSSRYQTTISADIVGYSDARVVQKDLTEVMSFVEYMKANAENKPTEVKISTAEELSVFGSYKDSYEGVTIYLANDIDMSGYSFTSVGGETSEGATTPFRGTFDGQGYEIDNLVIKADSTQCVGFFGNLQGATVRNLILGENCSISGGTNRVGAIAAMISGDAEESTTIDNCWNKADVSGSNFVSGIVGFVYVTGEKCKLSDGTKQTAEGAKAAAAVTTHYIRNCTNTGNITALAEEGNEAKTGRDVGGIVGISQTGLELTNCRNVGNISANGGNTTQGCGGIIGRISNNAANIFGCINNGMVSSDTCTVAGIAGNVRAAGVSIKHSANHGTVIPASGFPGVAIFASDTKKAVAEENNSGVTVQTVDYSLDVALVADTLISGHSIDDSGNVVSDDIVGYSDERVVQVDLTNIPGFIEFMNSSGDSRPKEVKITTAEELSLFSTYGDTYEGVTIYLGNDIDMSGSRFYSIGGEVSEAGTIPFKGTFDGQGYEVDNLVIVAADFDCVGFFGNLQGATVRNLILGENCFISEGRNRVGGIAGMISGQAGESTTIDNCWNKAEVSGTSFVGGIVGFVYVTNQGVKLPNDKLQTEEGAKAAAKATTHYISNCTNTGAISAIATADDPAKTGRDAGGIVGISQTGLEITNCRNAGSVTATGGEAIRGCGGILGRMANNPATLIGCINNGAVHSDNCTTGGIVGNITVDGGLIMNCYNYGEITGALANAIYGSSSNKHAMEISNVGTMKAVEDTTLSDALSADTLIVGWISEKTDVNEEESSEAASEAAGEAEEKTDANGYLLLVVLAVCIILAVSIVVTMIAIRKNKKEEGNEEA